MSTPHGRRDASAPAVRELSTAQCWVHLEGQSLARIAVVDAAGEPRLYPVNYACADGAIYLRTANDSKLRHLRAHPVIALEIDGRARDEWWSVVVRGTAHVVETDAELRRSRAAGLSSMIPTVKPFVVRVQPTAIGGRRFREMRGRDERDSVPALVPVVNTLTGSAGPPHPIPHYSPFAHD